MQDVKKEEEDYSVCICFLFFDNCVCICCQQNVDIKPWCEDIKYNISTYYA